MIKLILNKNENGKDVIKLILDEFKKLKKNNLSKKDLDEYKRKYIEQFKIKLKETQFKNDYVFSNLFYNPNFTLEKFIKKNEDVTSDKINNIVMKILNFHQMNIVLYGNFMDINITNNNIFNLIEKIRG
jgi:predicted Zn-dependent peptidase